MNRKAVPSVVITLFILLAFPTISLYYSFQGAALRKTALKELEVKGLLPDSVAIQIQSDAPLKLIGNICPDTMSMRSLIQQFLPEKIAFIIINDSAFYTRYQSDYAEKWMASGKIQLIHNPGDHLFSKPCSFILADDKNQILSTYDFSNAVQKTRLVEHIALLVTRK